MLNGNTEENIKYEKFIDSMMEIYDLPGLAIGILQAGKRYKTVRGFRNYITKDPLGTDDIFHCASISKLFTSMGIMKLVEDGKLNLDSKLVDLLPYLSIADRRCVNATVFQMLTHTSGIGDVSDYCWHSPKLDEYALKGYALSDKVSNTPLLWEPGEGGFRYSNIAYELLGLIISELSAMTYEDYMKKNFLEPAGMASSEFLTFERTGGSLELEDIDKTNMAMPHTKASDRSIILERYYPYNREHGPSSTLTSNTEDLMNWAQANLQQQFLKAETYDRIMREYAVVPNNGEGMGLGWFIRKQEGFTLVGHEGTDDGFRASLWLCPELELATVVLSNISVAPVKKINKKLFAEIIKF